MTPGIRPLIAGNWKMNGTLAGAQRLAEALRGAAKSVTPELLVCPPFLHLQQVAAVLLGSPIALGGQDCHHAAAGAHTGDIAAAMLRDAGASHVILGHSERRSDHAETSAIVLRKCEAALAALPGGKCGGKDKNAMGAAPGATRIDEVEAAARAFVA